MKPRNSPKKKLFIMNSQDWEKSNHIVFLRFAMNFGQMFAEMQVEWAKLEVIRVVCSFSFNCQRITIVYLSKGKLTL